MSFDETFRPRAYIHERDTFDVIGKPRRVREIRPSGFEGPVAEWADYREALYGDKVVPVMTMTEGSGDDAHHVAWVYHQWENPSNGDMHSRHHIACDCSMMAELSGESESIYECPTLQKTIFRRAGIIRGTLLLDKVLYACTNSEESRWKITLDRQFIVAETVMWVLNQDQHHPESWMGNIVSGEHSVSLLALIVQQDPEVLREVIGDLEDDGRLELDPEGEIVKLSLAA